MEKPRFSNVFNWTMLVLFILTVLAFLFSSKFRFIVVGLAVIVGLFWAGSKLEDKKIKNILFIIAGVGAIVFLVIMGVSQDFTGNTPYGTYVQSPTFYYYECSPATEPVESTHVTITSGASGWITAPSNTDEWDLYVAQTEEAKWFSTDRSILYQICHSNGNCDSQVRVYSSDTREIFTRNSVPTLHIPNLLVGDRVYVNYQSKPIIGAWKDKENSAEWYQTYKPFILWKNNMFDGGRTEYSSIEKGCSFSYQEKISLLDSLTNSKKQINDQSSKSDSTLGFYKTRNFIGTYVPLSKNNVNFVDVNGETGYCLNRQVFAITTATTNSNTYQIVDSNFNNLLRQSVDCCPGEKEPTRTCNDNFEWVSIQEAECSLFNPCQGADWIPSTSQKLVRYNCIDSQCVPEYQNVDCTSNSDCLANEVCDTKDYTCVTVVPGEVDECATNDDCLTGEVCEDGVCIGLTCDKFWQEEGVKTTYKVNILGILKFGEVEEPVCKTADWVYYVLGSLIIIILGSIALVLYSKKGNNK